MKQYDVIVAGGGFAGVCAAIAASPPRTFGTAV